MSKGLSDQEKLRKMFSLPSSTSTHTTVINAPADVVWESLSDIHEWQWNRWVRLDAALVQTGKIGTSKISVDGNGRWRKRKFNFTAVNRRDLILTWTTKLGFCFCTNKVKLTPLGSKRTHIEHTQTIKGFCPWICFGNNTRLKKHPLCINEALKNHVESQYFRSLLYTLSTRELQMDKSDSTLDTGSLGEVSPAGYWETPRHLRKELISCYIGDIIV